MIFWVSFEFYLIVSDGGVQYQKYRGTELEVGSLQHVWKSCKMFDHISAKKHF